MITAQRYKIKNERLKENSEKRNCNNGLGNGETFSNVEINPPLTRRRPANQTLIINDYGIINDPNAISRAAGCVNAIVRSAICFHSRAGNPRRGCVENLVDGNTNPDRQRPGQRGQAFIERPFAEIMVQFL